jgi:phosphatidylserine synthase
MDLLSGYRASLKPLDVEEPIDVFVHRPLGYLFARIAFPTPLSPDLVTLLSIVAGIASGVCIVLDFRFHMQVGGLLLFTSAVLDCADGQLARMRKTSSPFGRMIDGVADLITTSAVVPATLWTLWRMYATPPWLGGTVVALGVLTVVTSSFHTTMYDHYKNVFVRLTTSQYKEGEDYETALARWNATRHTQSWWRVVAWRIYLFYIKSGADFVHKFDPYTSARLNLFPDYDPGRAAIYKQHVGPVMRVWRSFLGFGSMVFGLALFLALERPDIYLVFRLVLLNGLFYLYLRPRQRRASQAAFAAMNLHLPDQSQPA